MSRMPFPHRSLLALCAMATALGCQQAPGKRLMVNNLPQAAKAGSLPALPAFASRRFIVSDADGSLGGTVSPPSTLDAFIANEDGSTRQAHVYLGTADEELYFKSDKPVSTTTTLAPTGSFSLSGAPSVPSSVNVILAQSHRLSAVAYAGATNVQVDAASTLVTETLRFLVAAHRSQNPVKDTTFQAVPQATYEQLVSLTRAGLTAGSIPTPGADSYIWGSTLALRNEYVKAFGAKASLKPLADLWAQVAGHRRLAVTTFAGTGISGFNQSDGKPPAEAQFFAPTNAVVAPNGDTYVADTENQRIRLIPASGNLSTILGRGDGFTDGPGYNGFVNDPNNAYQGAVVNPANPPIIFGPYGLVIGTGPYASTGATPTLFFTSQFGNRVLCYYNGPSATHFGIQMDPGRLYIIAGSGQDGFAGFDANNNVIFFYGDTGGAGVPADADPNDNQTDALRASFGGLGGLTFDPNGDLYVCDVEHRAVRRISRADGSIRTFAGPVADSTTDGYNPIQTGDFGQPSSVRWRTEGDGSQSLYLVSKSLNTIFRFNGPNAAALGAGSAELGQPTQVPQLAIAIAAPNQADNLDTTRPVLRDIFGTPVRGAGNAKQPIPVENGLFVSDPGGGALSARLNQPTDVAWDALGNMIVSDTGNFRVRLVRRDASDGNVRKVYSIAGASNSSFQEGDSRYCNITPAFLSLDGAGNLIIPDRGDHLIRKLWIQYGALDNAP